jgi:hypothetical protein
MMARKPSKPPIEQPMSLSQPLRIVAPVFSNAMKQQVMKAV